MTNLRSAARLVLTCSAFLILAAEAQSAVRFVASNGVDTRPCTRTLPCRQLQRAVNVAAAGDEIVILDTGQYSGTVSIGKPVTISADGISASLLHTAAAGSGVLINGSGIVVTLRGLSLSGAGVGLRGITIQQAGAVSIENCELECFKGDAILVSNSSAEVFVADSTSHHNIGRGFAFITNVAAKLAIENSQFQNNNSHGIHVSGPVQASIARSVVSGSGGSGVVQQITGARMNLTWLTATQNAGAGIALLAGQMTIEESLANSNAGAGLSVAAGATARISNSTFVNNGTGISNGGTTLTRQNNTISGNTTNLSGAGLAPLAGT